MILGVILLHHYRLEVLWLDHHGGSTVRTSKQVNILTRIAGELGDVRRETLTEQLVQKLKSLILREMIVPGECLPPERELAAMLRVSRASLRGALKVLQIMGVLEVRQGSRTYLTAAAKEILSVPPRVLVPPQGLTQAELFEARRAIEAESAATAAERATETDLERMRAEFDAMKSSAASHDIPLYGKHDMAFHQSIAEASGNKFFVWFLATANRALFRELWKRPPHIDVNRSLQGHERILKTIEAKDRAAARAEMLNHLSYMSYFVDQSTLVDLSAPATHARGIAL